ncbi:FmdB family zinc ribbon protein [Chloroflexota bacterium]
MPIYEYECSECGFKFVLRKRFIEDTVSRCPKCEVEVERSFSSVPIIFKDSGFYVTDHRDNHSSGGSSA